MYVGRWPVAIDAGHPVPAASIHQGRRVASVGLNLAAAGQLDSIGYVFDVLAMSE